MKRSPTILRTSAPLSPPGQPWRPCARALEGAVGRSYPGIIGSNDGAGSDMARPSDLRTQHLRALLGEEGHP